MEHVLSEAFLVIDVQNGFCPGGALAVLEGDKVTPTGLHGYLKDREVTDLTRVGLATDFCVAFSALDAERLGYQVTVSLDMVRAIDADGSLRSAVDKMSKVGVNLVNG